MTIINDLKTTPRHDRVKGSCAKCHAEVYEDLWLLDDAYNVWMGRCPYCKALNYLALVGLRGYTRDAMSLVLPTLEEVRANNLPEGTPNSGPCGVDATAHREQSRRVIASTIEGVRMNQSRVIFVCGGCGKQESGSFGRGGDAWKPHNWYQRSDEEGTQLACSRECIGKVAASTGKTDLVLPV